MFRTHLVISWFRKALTDTMDALHCGRGCGDYLRLILMIVAELQESRNACGSLRHRLRAGQPSVPSLSIND
jgi:hypothetical protein